MLGTLSPLNKFLLSFAAFLTPQFHLLQDYKLSEIKPCLIFGSLEAIKDLEHSRTYQRWKTYMNKGP